jgi:hypothetical protein
MKINRQPCKRAMLAIHNLLCYKTMPSLSGSLGWIMRARMGVNVHRED